MKDKNLYNETLDNLYKKYETSINGLTEEEAKARLEKYGVNKLEERQKESFIVKIFKQLTSMSVMFLNCVILFCRFFWGLRPAIMHLMSFSLENTLSQRYRAAFSFSATARLPWYRM